MSSFFQNNPVNMVKYQVQAHHMVKNQQNYKKISRESNWDSKTWAWQKWQDNVEPVEGVDEVDERETVTQVA